MLTRFADKNGIAGILRIGIHAAGYSRIAPKQEEKVIGEFRVYKLIPKTKNVTRFTAKETTVPPPRTNRMATDQDWTSVWPGPRSFHPATVPLPIRQGYPLKREAPPSKYGNAELVKIPNFLHLTPPTIERHCRALKEFCTDWPQGLRTEEDYQRHFPLEAITSDYCYAGPSIADPLARIVALRVKLSSLSFQEPRAKDKFLRLVGNRYNPTTDLVTITADRCPTRKQNFEYAQYLFTAAYNEAWRVEPWEAEKTLADMEYYDWEKNKSRETMLGIRAWPNPPQDTDIETMLDLAEYKVAVTDLINNGEDPHSLNKYRDAVKTLLHLKK